MKIIDFFELCLGRNGIIDLLLWKQVSGGRSMLESLPDANHRYTIMLNMMGTIDSWIKISYTDLK
jgi:hypothetical protein